MQTLLDRNISIFHSRALRLVSHRETLKPDGAYPTQNIMKRTGGGGGGGEDDGDLRQMLMYLAVFHAWIYWGGFIYLIAKHTSTFTQLIQQQLLYSTSVHFLLEF